MTAFVARIRRQLSDARPAKHAGLILLALAAFTVVGTSAWAYWTTIGHGTASATTGTLNPPTSVTASNTAGSSTVTVSWTASTGTTVPQGYYVTRIKSDTTTAFACGSSLTTFATSPCTDSAVPDGTFHYTVTAVYHSWSATSTSSGDVTVTSSIATTTAVTSSSNPSVVGQSVLYTATVTPNSGSTTPTGTVTFKDGSATITCTGGNQSLNGPGVATCQFTYSSVGTHSITAVYAGAGSFTASTSSVLSQTVNKAGTTTSLTSSLSTTVVGQPVTFTATVAAVSPGAGVPTGLVTFKDNGTDITCTSGTQTLNGTGVATCTLASAGVSAHPITAVYPADANYLTSTSSTLTQTINKASTTTSVVSSANPSVTGQSVTYTATVAAVSPGAGTPTGTVTFRDGAATITCTGGSATLSAGVATCQFVYTGVSSHLITAVYPGDTNFLTSTSTAFTQTVNQATSISSLAITNKSVGGTAGRAEAGDKITVTFSAGLQVSSICSAWTGNGSNQTNSTANVHISGNGTTANNIVTISTWSGCPVFFFGSIDLGSQAYVTSTGSSNKPADFSGSKVDYDATAHTITITLGTEVPGGSQGTLGTVTSSNATLTADAAVKDINGSSILPLTKATGSIQQF